jgi:rod shape-determining protein MreD
MRTVTHVLFAFALTVVAGSVWRVAPFDVAAPDLAVLVALYLGASVRGHAWEATLAALLIGYLADVVGGAPRGLGALVLGSTCLLARLATARLLVRGTIFTAVFSWLGALFASAATLLARAAYGARAGDLDRELAAALGATVLTAVLAPLVFRACRGIDARYARTAREREALREGYLT